MKNTDRIQILEYQVKVLSEQTAILTSSLLEMLDASYKNSLSTAVKIGESTDKSLKLILAIAEQEKPEKAKDDLK